MKLEVWCDSGANIHSCRKVIVDVETDLGLDLEEWDEMSDVEREDAIKEIAFERLDWGFREIE